MASLTREAAKRNKLSTCEYSVADPGEGPGGAAPPSQGLVKASPYLPPPIPGSGESKPLPPPPHLKVWIRH